MTSSRFDLRSSSTLLLMAGALLLAWLLYPRPRAAQQVKGITEIVYWTRPGTYIESIKPAIEEFQRRNPQYRVVMSMATSRDATGDPTRLLLGVAGDVPPDLILFDRFAIVEWASRGAFTDLSPFIEHASQQPNAIRSENFFPPAWNETIYKGAVYAVPMDADTRAMYYNSDALARAGLVYTENDPKVRTGEARVGEARPPVTWEEMLRKRVHAIAEVREDGGVELKEWVRRPAVNEGVAADALLNLNAAGVRPGDVVALVRGQQVFRARVEKVVNTTNLQLDLVREQPSGLGAVPADLRGGVEVKIFDQDSYVAKLTRFHPQTGQITQAGFVPFYGNSWLYMFGFLNDAPFLSKDGREVLLDGPEVVEALTWVTDIHDAMGGAKNVYAFQKSAESAGLQRGAESGANVPFIAGRIAMLIDTDTFMQLIMAFSPNMAFGITAGPIPERRLNAGEEAVGWGGGWAMAIPSTAKSKEGAFALATWLASEEANQLVARAEASFRRSVGQVYFPPLHADRRVTAWLQQTFVEGNPNASPSLKKAYADFADLLPRSRYRPVTPVGQMLWAEHVRASESAVNHSATPYEALNYGKRRVQAALDNVLNPPQGAPVNWPMMVGLYVALVGTLLGAYVFVQERRRRVLGHTRREYLEGLIAVSPWLIGFIVLGLGPILFSVIISFCRYDVLTPATFVGLDNYTGLLGKHYDPVVERVVWNDAIFWKSLGNTAYMIITVPLGIVLGLGLAVLLDSGVRGLNAYRTVYYLPSIVPAVASFILWFWLLDASKGPVNKGLMLLGVDNPPNWLWDPAWSKPALVLMTLWGVGASMIIWLAGLKDIPESYYEAAEVDGANAVQRFFRITLPLLSPYILFNTIMGMIGVFQIFEAAFIMTDGGPADSTLFFAYKLFNEAFRFLNMGTASAMAWILFVVVLGITLLQLWLSKRVVHYGD